MKTPRTVVRGIVIIVGAVAFALSGVPALGAAEPPAAETAATLVQKMVKAYASASSYQDEGTTLSHDSRKPSPDEIVFATFFKRSGFFRFEWTSHHPHPPLRHLKTYSVTWSDAAGVHTFRQPPIPPRSAATEPASTLRDDESMSMAIAGATGVSRGSAHHVLRLLTNEISGFAISELQSPTLVGTDEIEGVVCYHLTGMHPRGGSPYHFWIGKSDYLIRRITRTNGASGNEQEETRRNIRINHPISDDVFDPLRAKPTK